MGRKGNWFSTVKKALSPESKEKKDQKSSRSKKKWFGKQKLETSEPHVETDTSPPLPPPEEVILTHVENENNHNNVEITIAADAEGSIPAVQTEVAEVQATTVVQFACKPSDEVAALKIQTAFRGYMARRALRALRGLVRLKSLMAGPVVKRQAISTLRSMQTLAHVQSQIRSRRLRMLEENQALQKQLLSKHTKELESLKIGEEWDDSLQSKEQVEAKLLSKYEATMRRERAMAYSFSHQQNKDSSKSINPMFMDPTNPSWGWSWLERWMAGAECQNLTAKEKNDQSSAKSSSRMITSAEISKSFARFQLNSENHSPTASQNPGSPNFQSHSNPPKPAASKKLKKASPRDSRVMDDDMKSMVSMQSERRHSIAGSTIRDDESLASSPSVVPSYMVPTKSAKAKSRMQSPLAAENGTPEKGGFGTAKKRLSFPASPARPRRHSGPPKVDSSLNAEITVGNGVAG
ncbi:protein IQ-DOMAIN 2 isoform X2 [Lotus japonicus]|uniref:protein IQ-DOMAIN 2 isoform X2 n=1 Tax=Lotus japonicus TaxID=34305 RepID=UPI00258F15FF|nr:protein IQ-DOMAIN 2 isoform X2 [Lotus japonicus]XP_057423710.1 protein IQ-DOMAIN 2 isoform X2 [Lotus japonicus]